VPWMKDLMGSRWATEPTEEESCFPSLLGLRGHGGGLEAAGCSSCEAWEEAEERLLPHEEPAAGDDMVRTSSGCSL